MHLLIIRHAEPIRLEVAEGPADPPLHERGRRQASLLTAWLAAEQVDVVLSSPLAAAHGIGVDIVDDVAEYDRNLNWYVPIEELKAANDERWQAMARGDYFGEDEDETTFTARVVGAFESIIDANPSRTVAVVCHGGVINVYLSSVLRRTGSPMFFLPAYTSISRVAAERAGVRSVVSLNETAHLRPPL